MENNRRLIDADAAFRFFKDQKVRETGAFSKGVNKGLNIAKAAMHHPDAIATVDAVEVVRIEALKQEILQKMDEFIAEYRRISESYVDHFGGKADAMEVARRLVNAALTDLCSCGERKNDG